MIRYEHTCFKDFNQIKQFYSVKQSGITYDNVYVASGHGSLWFCDIDHFNYPDQSYTVSKRGACGEYTEPIL